MVCDALANSAAVTRSGWLPEGRVDHRRSGPTSSKAKRHGSRRTDANRQTEAIRHLSLPQERMKNRGPWKCRSDGQRGKPKAGFPRCPQPLEIAERDFHISTAPATRGKVENQQQVSHFPTCCFLSQHQTKKGGPAAVRFAPAFRLILQ